MIADIQKKSGYWAQAIKAMSFSTRLYHARPIQTISPKIWCQTMNKWSWYFVFLMGITSDLANAQEDNFPLDFLKKELFAKSSIGQAYAKPTNDEDLSAACVAGMAKWRIADQAEQMRFVRQLASLNRPQQNDIQQLVETINAKKISTEERTTLADFCITGMIRSLDLRSQYYSQKDMALIAQHNRDNWGEVRLQIQYENGAATIKHIPADSAGNRSGLHVGDRIKMIGNETLIANDPIGYRNLIRGPIGSKVTLTVLRDDAPRPIPVEVDREKAIRTPIKSERLGKDLLYISAIKTDLLSLVEISEALKKQNVLVQPLKGLILDLRNNPGDALPSVVGVAAAFLKPETSIGEVRMSEHEPPYRLYANPKFYRRDGQIDPFENLPAWTKTIPIAVLTNAVTGNGAELIAAALKDNNRAIIIGQTSAGKAFVQSEISNAGTVLRITSGYLYRPSRAPIDGVGVTPDIEVPPYSSQDGNTPREKDETIATAMHVFLSTRQ